MFKCLDECDLLKHVLSCELEILEQLIYIILDPQSGREESRKFYFVNVVPAEERAKRILERHG